jgi:hypothetical protein
MAASFSFIGHRARPSAMFQIVINSQKVDYHPNFLASLILMFQWEQELIQAKYNNNGKNVKVRMPNCVSNTDSVTTASDCSIAPGNSINSGPGNKGYIHP